MFLTKEQLINNGKLKFEDVELPEFGEGCKVRVSELTASDRDSFENWILKNKDSKTFENFRARLFAMSVIDPETGKKIFEDEDGRIDEEIIIAIGKNPSSAIERVADVTQRLSGMKKEDLDKMTKNSSSAQ